MQSSKDYLKESGYLPRISFKETSKATVKLLSDEQKTINAGTPEEIKGMSYKVEQDGEEKEIFTSSIGLISKLSECEKGDVVNIEMKSKKQNGKFISYFEVSKEGEEPKSDIAPISDEDIPVVNDEE